MLISEFSQATGLSRDTVRFYVRLGLICPKTGSKGGVRPYLHFSEEHVQAVKIIRIAQSLGMSLKEIAAISKERREGRMTRGRSIDVLKGHIESLEAKATEIQSLSTYLRAKIAWLECGEHGPQPDFECKQSR
ncbi:MerR family transcriptional regulator [Paraburkholderia bengalensis]|uniref:MerR family transcriptional regulator n=1 Tax=Paraburkholderia bengalensis TaxID=2747562 RepID=A0ABU8J1Y0_9BURK